MPHDITSTQARRSHFDELVDDLFALQQARRRNLPVLLTKAVKPSRPRPAPHALFLKAVDHRAVLAKAISTAHARIDAQIGKVPAIEIAEADLRLRMICSRIKFPL